MITAVVSRDSQAQATEMHFVHSVIIVRGYIVDEFRFCLAGIRRVHKPAAYLGA